MIKIHDQPDLPPTPFIRERPYPRIPPKAPAMTAPAKKREIRLEASFRLYHPDKKNEIPATHAGEEGLVLVDER